MGNCCFRAGAEVEAAWDGGVRAEMRFQRKHSTENSLKYRSVYGDAIVGPSAASNTGKAFPESRSTFCSPKQQQIAHEDHVSKFGAKRQPCCGALGSGKSAAVSNLQAPGSNFSHASTDSSSHVSTTAILQDCADSTVSESPTCDSIERVSGIEPVSNIEPVSSRSSSRDSSDSGHTAFASIPASLCPSGSLTPGSMVSALSTSSSCGSSNSSSYGGSCPRSKSAGGMLAAAAVAVAVAGKQQQQQQQAASGDANFNPQQGSMAVLPEQQRQQQYAAYQAVGSPIEQQHVSSSPLAAPIRATTEEGSDGPDRKPFWKLSGWSFGEHSEQNQRQYMEDRTVAVDLTGHAAFRPADRAGLFSVFDGHGGHQVAEFLADHVRDQLLSAGVDAIAAKPLRVLGNAVEDAERQLLASYTEGNKTAAAGSTLCAVLLLDDQLHVAHVGDSRAVLARGSTAKQLTRDHKPVCEIEARRIKSDDPEAVITSDGYLYSELAVARAIGSAHLKRDPSKRALIATAEVTSVQLEQQDDFVIVATDGLWDTISSSEAVSVARRVLSDTKDAGAASRALVERAQRCGSSDNISVVTLLLHGRPIVVPRSNSRLFKRPASQQLGAASSTDSPRST